MRIVAAVLLLLTHDDAAANNMNHGHYKIANSDTFVTDYHDEYFDVYSHPIRTRYSEVHWQSHGDIPLPREIRKRFENKKIMAVIGYEVDQVRRIINTTTTEIPVPITWAYNHHYGAFLQNQRNVKLVRKTVDDAATEQWLRGRNHGSNHYLGSEFRFNSNNNNNTQLQFFSEGNGGEMRMSYHGYPTGYAQLIESPDTFHVIPMQIDTWNRDTMSRRYHPGGPRPQSSQIPQDAGYNGLLECPCSDRLEKKWEMTYKLDDTTTCPTATHDEWGEETAGPIATANECWKAAKQVLQADSYHYNIVNDAAAGGAGGCCTAEMLSNGSARVIWNSKVDDVDLKKKKDDVLWNETTTPEHVVVAVALSEHVTAAVALKKKTTDKIVVHLRGPADKWFGIAFDDTYGFLFDGEHGIQERYVNEGIIGELIPMMTTPNGTAAAAADILTTNQVHKDGTRTVVFERIFLSADKKMIVSLYQGCYNNELLVTNAKACGVTKSELVFEKIKVAVPVPQATTCEECWQEARNVMKASVYRRRRRADDKELPRGCSVHRVRDGAAQIVWNGNGDSLTTTTTKHDSLFAFAMSEDVFAAVTFLKPKEEEHHKILVHLRGPSEQWFGIAFGTYGFLFDGREHIQERLVDDQGGVVGELIRITSEGGANIISNQIHKDGSRTVVFERFFFSLVSYDDVLVVYTGCKDDDDQLGTNSKACVVTKKELVFEPIGTPVSVPDTLTAKDCWKAARNVMEAGVYRRVIHDHKKELPVGCSVHRVRDGAAQIVWNEPNLVAVALGQVRLLVTLQMETVDIQLTGPADKWFGVGFGTSTMCAQMMQGDECPQGGPYAIIVQGEDVQERKLGFHGPGTVLDATSVTVKSNTVVNGTRTVVLSRPLQGATDLHYTFDRSVTKLPVIMAKGCGLEFAQHCGHGPAELNFLPLQTPMTLCRNGISGTIGGNRFNNERCMPFPQSVLQQQHNPTCKVQTYRGGLSCCRDGQSLLDKDQEIPWPDQVLEYYLKFRFYFQEYTPALGSTPASHHALVRLYWQTEAHAGEYDIIPCTEGLPPSQCVQVITARWTVLDMMDDCDLRDASWCTGVGSSDPIKTQGVKLIYAAPHCHAPTCLSMELYNADTGRLLCQVEPYHGKGQLDKDIYDEEGFLAIPPCLWGDQDTTLESPELLTLNTTLLSIKRNNNTYPHTGEMASWQMRGIVVPVEQGEEVPPELLKEDALPEGVSRAYLRHNGD